jgi:outer membrane biosynthesis protein TonB
MAATTYRQLALSWHPQSGRDHTFNIIAAVTLVGSLLLGLLLSSITVPKAEQHIRALVPDRVARFIVERPKPTPRPVVTPPPAQLPKPEPRVERPAPQERKPLTKAEQRARKSIEGTGLLALAKELSDLADTSSVNTMVATKVNTAPANTQAATVDTGILTAGAGGGGGAGKGSGGVGQGAHVGNVGTTTLDDNQRRVAQGLLAAQGAPGGQTRTAATGTSAGGAGAKGRGGRTEEEVGIVLDQHKSALHSIYNRARRTNPGIKGKIVLVITVLPSGKVSNVVPKSSELNAPELEASLLARIRQIEFGQREGGVLTVTVPIEFLP